jgi:hypothetical protein
VHIYRSSGSFVQRVATTLRSRRAKSRRSLSEIETLDDRILFDPTLSSPHIITSITNDNMNDLTYQQTPPPRSAPQLPSIDPTSPFHPSFSVAPFVTSHEANDRPPRIPHRVDAEIFPEQAMEEDRQNLNDESSNSGYEDGPSPQERQKSQELVTAWLDTGRKGLGNTSALLEEEEEENGDEVDLMPVRQPLRMLDSISEDEIPEFAGSAVSTAPSTPMLQHNARADSRSPPSRRRSLDGQDEFPNMRGLEPIQEAGDSLYISPRRRSLDSARPPPLESIPEVDLSMTSAHPKRRMKLKGFGLARSESEPAIASLRNSPPASKRKSPPVLAINVSSNGVGNLRSSNSPHGSFSKPASSGVPKSPSLPSFQRSTNIIMGQRPTPNNGSRPDPRQPLNPTRHTLGSISTKLDRIEDKESRRLTEIAYIM